MHRILDQLDVVMCMSLKCSCLFKHARAFLYSMH